MTPQDIAASLEGLPRWQQVARIAAMGYAAKDAAIILGCGMDAIRVAAHAARDRHDTNVVWQGNRRQLEPPEKAPQPERRGMMTKMRKGEISMGRMQDMLVSLPHDVQDWIMAGVGGGTICDAVRAIIIDAHRDDMGPSGAA